MVEDKYLDHCLRLAEEQDECMVLYGPDMSEEVRTLVRAVRELQKKIHRLEYPHHYMKKCSDA